MSEEAGGSVKILLCFVAWKGVRSFLHRPRVLENVLCSFQILISCLV